MFIPILKLLNPAPSQPSHMAYKKADGTKDAETQTDMAEGGGTLRLIVFKTH